ncbi:MAG: glycosyltransferase family 4 protein [Rhodospirillales bacterium]|nr:glycosyltransferase family 4 protein [Rhodospirillales bacterium]
MKLLEIANVGFSLDRFVLPLMRAARARGHEVVGVAAEDPFLDRVRAEGFRVVPLPFGRRLLSFDHPRAYRALLGLMRAERPDLVHAHMPVSGVLARLAARRAGVKRIATTCHGFWFDKPGSLPRRALGFASEYLAGRCTDIFLTVAEADAATARRFGIAPNAVAIGNGRDPAVFRPDPAARARVRAAMGVPETRVVVLTAARLVRHKGFPELAAAMRTLPEAELWVAGMRLPSDQGPDMRALLEGAGLGRRLKVLGFRDDMPALLAAADIFALPSHLEGLPLAVIEAMLAGLPVVACDIGGPREQVLEGETGFLVPRGAVAELAAALGRLAADPGARAAMGAAGRARAISRYDEAAVLARSLALLGL